MRRVSPSRTLMIALAGVAIAIVVVTVEYQRRKAVRLQLHAQNVAKAQQLKDEIEQQFAAGAPQQAVSEFFRSRQLPAVFPESHDYWLSIGKEPSGVWYCGPMDTGLVVTFSPEHRLLSTRITTWGTNCL